jgi:hypothetical protein
MFLKMADQVSQDSFEAFKAALFAQCPAFKPYYDRELGPKVHGWASYSLLKVFSNALVSNSHSESMNDRFNIDGRARNSSVVQMIVRGLTLDLLDTKKDVEFEQALDNRSFKNKIASVFLPIVSEMQEKCTTYAVDQIIPCLVGQANFTVSQQSQEQCQSFLTKYCDSFNLKMTASTHPNALMFVVTGNKFQESSLSSVEDVRTKATGSQDYSRHILFHDPVSHNFVCTCFRPRTCGLPCVHFFSCFRASDDVCFHLGQVLPFFYKQTFIGKSDLKVALMFDFKEWKETSHSNQYIYIYVLCGQLSMPRTIPALLLRHLSQ